VPTLVVLGDQDFAGPADRLVDALAQGELVTLPGVDHFATPSNFGCIDAVLRFLTGSAPRKPALMTTGRLTPSPRSRCLSDAEQYRHGLVGTSLSMWSTPSTIKVRAQSSVSDTDGFF